MARRPLLTDEERQLLFGVPGDRDALARHFTFTRSDQDLVAGRRGAANRLGFFLNSGDRAERTLLAETPSPRNRELCESQSFDLGCDLTG
jgi:hypothetical protein